MPGAADPFVLMWIISALAFLACRYEQGVKKLSVIVNGVSNNERFINNLFTEISNEITTKIGDNEISFLDVDDNNKCILYKALAKNIVNEFCKKNLN